MKKASPPGSSSHKITALSLLGITALLAVLLGKAPSSTADASPDETVRADQTGTTVYLPFIQVPVRSHSDLEVTQAVQQPGNSVLLVAGRSTYVRYALTSASSFADVNAYLHGGRGGNLLPGSPIPALNNPRTLEASADRSILADTFNFELPLSWVSGTVELWGSATNGDDFDVMQGPVTVSFVQTDPMRVTIVPISYNCETGGSGVITPSEPYDYLIDHTFRIYPVPSIQFDVHYPLSYAGPCTNGLPDPGYDPDPSVDGEWEDMLDLVTMLWTSEGNPDSYYYGLLDIYCDSSCIAGIGWLGGYRAAVGYTGIGPAHAGASETHAHEVGHNHGREHAPGCGAALPDLSYPYLDSLGRAIIGDGLHANFGFDIQSLAIKPYSDFYDVMSYCNPEWISDYTYEALWDYDSSPSIAPQSLESPQGTLLVSGWLSEDGRISFRPAYRLDVAAYQPKGGEYDLIMLDAQGRELGAYAFTPVSTHGDRIGGGPTESSMAFHLAIPYAEGLAAIRVSKDGAEMGTLRASPVSSDLRLKRGALHIREGILQVEWTGAEGLSYLARISTDGGTTWQIVGANLSETRLALPIGVVDREKLLLEVYASDGIHTTRLDR